MTQKITFSAIICEFDPLHHGHRLLLEKAGADNRPVICVMSGNFVQRGSPAMLDKWTRARLALLNGADLVVELPLSWACAGAERFALGGVALASSFGPGELFFGSEVPDAALLMRTAEALLSPEFSRELANAPAGQSFAARRQLAIERLLGPAAGRALTLPNANLGVEYCKAILAQGSRLTPIPIPRQGAAHDQEAPSGRSMSASALRKRILAGEDIAGLAPDSTVQAVAAARQQGRCAHISYLERAILCRLRSMSPHELSRLPDLSEGLENRLFQAIRQARTLTELYGLTKNKRISHARVRRLVLAAFLGLSAPLPRLPPSLRVLGAAPKGWQALGELSPSLPIVVRSRDVDRLSSEAQAVFRQEALAGGLYALASPTPQPAGSDYTQPVVKL